MDKLLKPGKLSIDANSASAAKEWRYWKRSFDSYINKYLEVTEDGNEEIKKLEALISRTTPKVFDYIDHCTTFTDAVAILERMYIKKPNEIFARHCLATAKQRSNQSLEDFRCTLTRLSKDCNFKEVNALTYAEEIVRDVFINGIHSSSIRQRLLENKTLTF